MRGCKEFVDAAWLVWIQVCLFNITLFRCVKRIQKGFGVKKIRAAFSKKWKMYQPRTSLLSV